MKHKPKILICKEDYEQLHSLLDQLPRSPENDLLADELERAEIVERNQLPENVVRMHSNVTFTVLQTKKTYTVKLCYPNESGESGTLSILTPAGSAMIGLSIDQEIEWPLDGDKTTRVRINKTVEP